MTESTRKNAAFEWTNECMNAFFTLRDKLTEAPVLCVYDPKRETELHTDNNIKEKMF